MKSFSIYILVVITGVLFISSSPSSSLSEVNRPLKSDVKPKLDKEQIRKKVRRDLLRVRMGESVHAHIGKDNPPYSSGPFQIQVASPVSNNLEIMSEKEIGMVEESEQASLSEAAETFNRKCLEIEALLKEK